MKSEWLSTNPAHGSKVQFFSPLHSTYWTAWNNDWSTILATTSTPPSATVAFTVLRVSPTKVRLRTPGGTFLKAYSPSTCNACVGMTRTPNTDPTTVFTLAYSWPLKSTTLLTSFGTYVCTTNGYVNHFSRTPGDAEKVQIREVIQVAAPRGVNLGSWLVYEGWMNPSRMPAYTTLLDGTEIAIQSVSTGKWVYAINYGGGAVTSASTPGYFHILTRAAFSRTYALKAWGQTLLTSRAGRYSTLRCDVTTASRQGTEWFTFISKSPGSSQVLIRAQQGFLKVMPNGAILPIGPLSLNINTPGIWSSPYAFNIVKNRVNIGEWQLTYLWRGLRKPWRASAAYRTWITEADFQWLKAQNINAVRIPIGYWLTQNLRPEWPFLAGTAQALDFAMGMGSKYGIRIWLSMHGAVGSQSGGQNTGTRDGYIHFGQGTTVNRTLDSIRWLMKRYRTQTAFLGIGLLNEPSNPVTTPVLLNYYQQAVAIIRSYHPCLHISMEGIGQAWDVHWAFLGIPNCVLETHIYSIFTSLPNGSAALEVARWNSTFLPGLIDYQSRGMPLLVGEFSNAMRFPVSSYWQSFVTAQAQTLSYAKAGYFFWSYKTASANAAWDFRKAVDAGLVPKYPNGLWY